MKNVPNSLPRFIIHNALLRVCDVREDTSNLQTICQRQRSCSESIQSKAATVPQQVLTFLPDHDTQITISKETRFGAHQPHVSTEGQRSHTMETTDFVPCFLNCTMIAPCSKVQLETPWKSLSWYVNGTREKVSGSHSSS